MKIIVVIGLLIVSVSCSSNKVKQSNATDMHKAVENKKLVATANDLNYVFSGCKAHQ
jgi:hypothetical protein